VDGPLSRLDIWKGDTTAQGVTSRASTSAPAVTGPVRLSKIYPIPVTVDTWLLATVRGPIDNQRQSFALWPVVQSGMPRSRSPSDLDRRERRRRLDAAALTISRRTEGIFRAAHLVEGRRFPGSRLRMYCFPSRG